MATKSKALNIVISKSDLETVVKRAGLAALTEEGQSEVMRASNETKACIRVSAYGNKIVFDSSVSRFSSRYIISVGEGSDSKIISEGETCIPAKEVKAVSEKIRKGYMVSIEFSPVTEEPNANQVTSMLSDGVVEIGILKGDKVVSKVKIETYPTQHFSAPQYPEVSDLTVVISGKASCIKEPYGVVGFAINPADLKETYNKLAIFPAKDALFFLGSDGRRAALVQSKKDEKLESFLKVDDEKSLPVLIEVEYLSPVLSSIGDEEDVVLAMDKSEERVYVISGSTTYCINMVDKASRGKYPNYKLIGNLPINAVILADREELVQSIDMLGIVNKDRGNHTYEGNNIKLLGRGFGATKEATGEVPFTVVGDKTLANKDLCLHTKYLIEGLKHMTCEKVKLSFTKDEKRVKIEDEKDPKFIYYTQVMAKE
jgi:DNA polymerase III sliding clamp (beta) subunit (PCNA family)